MRQHADKTTSFHAPDLGIDSPCAMRSTITLNANNSAEAKAFFRVRA
jgi:hypothetical protein